VRTTTTASRVAPSLGRSQRSSSPGGPPGRRYGTTSPRLRAAGLLAAGVAAAVGLVAPGVAGAAVTTPRDVISFPSRDFVSASGYDVTQPVTVEVVHPNGTVAGTVKDVMPKEDPATPGLGLVEVNHPGGACWVGVTPDIRAGDVVRITNQVTGAVDTSTVRNVTAQRPVQTAPDTVQIHGTAQDSAGNPLPVAELEQRLVVPGDAFIKNARRTLRATSAAGADGTLSYDAAGSTHWTATYTNLVPDDVTRALGAESRGMWIDPALPSTESTIFENGAAAVAGPAAPCTAPLEKLPPPPGSETVPPSDVTGLTGSASNTTVTLNWSAATDNVGVTDYGIYRTDAAGVTTAVSTVQNPDGSNNPPTTFTDLNVAAGTYTYTVDAGDAVGNRSVNMSNAVTVTTAVNPASPATAPTPAAPHSLIGFPQRDFISATGYTPGTSYRFTVIRGGNVVSTSGPIVADATGLAEVNHPGGACWQGMTPNIQPGDTIRISGGGVTEQTTIAGVTDERPIVTSVDGTTGGGTIEVHGTAQDAAGNPLPIDQIEQRLVARKDSFDINGRRTIRAGAGLDGTLAYDAAGSTHWTAKYTLQSPDDLARAVGGRSTSGTLFDGSESRILWLGANPVIGTELTIYENGPTIAGGPAAGIAGCTSGPAEVPAPNAVLSAAPKAFADTAIGSTSTSQTVTLTNGGAQPLKVGRAYLAGLNPGDFTISGTGIDGTTLQPGATLTVTVAFKPQAAGTRQANLSFADDAANSTDQTMTLTGSTPAAVNPTASAPVQSLAAVFNDPIALLSPIANSTLPVDLTWKGSGTSFELQMATGASTASLGAFTAVSLPTSSATSTRVRLAMGNASGNAYQFRVRSCTGATCSAWANGPKFTLQPIDDAGIPAGQFKGTWTSVSLPGTTGAYGGTVRRASGSATATLVPAVTYTVSGNAAWVSTLGPDQGLAQVQVDNGKPEVVDLYSPTFQTRRVVWARDALAAGTHTVTLTVLGKKSTLNPGACNTGAKCAQVDIDMATLIK
jgi:hypothetical protein